MKILIANLLLSIMLFTACSEKESNPIKPISTDTKDLIIGTWLLSSVIVSYPEGTVEKSPDFFKAHCYMRFYENKRFEDYYKFNLYVYDYDGTYKIMSQNEIEMTIEDKRNPNNPNLFLYSTMIIKEITDKQIRIEGIARIYDENKNPHVYPATLVYNKN